MPKATPIEAFTAKRSPSPDLAAPLPERSMEALASSGVPTGGGAGSPPPGPIGEGAIRSSIPRLGPEGPQSDATLPQAEPGPTPATNQLEATARGMFLIPSGGGSGTGERGVGAAGHGTGRGGGGSGHEGEGGPGKPGGGGRGAGFAVRGGGGGTGDGDGVAALLRLIRRQIEQAKTYPDAARRGRIQGTVELRFRIATDGSVEAMEILRSSGSQILDEASERTIRRAAPYPPVRGWVRLPLSYRLDQ